MFIFWLISYLLVGFLCAVASEIWFEGDDDIRIVWLLVWPLLLVFSGFYESVEFCVNKYNDLKYKRWCREKDEKQRAAKTVVQHPTH